ncbi:MAG: PH domain-containing protein [Acidimicrobiales bacterium]
MSEPADSSAPLPADDRPHRPDPRARTLWTVAAAAGFALLSAPIGALLVVGGIWPAAPVLALAAAAGGALFGRAAWRRRSWSLGVSSLELRRGVVIQRASSIPYTRIQQIDVERGPVERLIGLSQLVVRTAAATTDGTLYGLAPHDATRIRQHLLEVAGVDDAV